MFCLPKPRFIFVTGEIFYNFSRASREGRARFVTSFRTHCHPKVNLNLILFFCSLLAQSPRDICFACRNCLHCCLVCVETQGKYHTLVFLQSHNFSQRAGRRSSQDHLPLLHVKTLNRDIQTTPNNLFSINTFTWFWQEWWTQLLINWVKIYHGFTGDLDFTFRC